MSSPILRAQSLSKVVQSGETPLTILDDVTFAVESGAAVAIVGASGSGKTTLLGLLAGLDRPTTGEVWLDGQGLSGLDEDARAALRQRLLGFVFQSFQLLPALTAMENVMLPLELAGSADAAARARVWLERVGLGKRGHHYPRQLSGGEQQRVAIARAFAGEPKLLMADEPTGNLDGATGVEVAELMFRLNREHGTTLVLVTHDLSLAARCGRRIALAAGRLVRDDHPAKVGSDSTFSTSGDAAKVGSDSTFRGASAAAAGGPSAVPPGAKKVESDPTFGAASK